MFAQFHSLSTTEPKKTISLEATSANKPIFESNSTPYLPTDFQQRQHCQSQLNRGQLEFQKQIANKRDFVDITNDDNDGEELYPSSRKRSRTLSNSTESLNENRLERPRISGQSPRLESKPRESAEKAPPISSTNTPPSSLNIPLLPSKTPPISSSPTLSSTEYASAVLIKKFQLSAEQKDRNQFLQNLSVLGRGISVHNDLDKSSPNLSFQFITESLPGLGVFRTTEDFMSGCKCRKDNGRQMGCEYLSCECLEDSALTDEGKRVFPYSASKADYGCLRPFYLNARHHIYECNQLCNCESNCKNRVVQHGRTVPLQIFKTRNRGWGLRCMEDLKKGQFIDTYRGEIITNEEANHRSKQRTVDEDIYLMDFDKWTEEEGAAQYVCDGKDIGGPTRFINHSCDPNCGIYTVSFNHADVSIYELAFFATEAIPKGAELTFDYVGDEDNTPITEKRADEIEKEKGYRPAKCLCGSRACRGYFFN